MRAADTAPIRRHSAQQDPDYHRDYFPVERRQPKLTRPPKDAPTMLDVVRSIAVKGSDT